MLAVVVGITAVIEEPGHGRVDGRFGRNLVRKAEMHKAFAGSMM